MEILKPSSVENINDGLPEAELRAWVEGAYNNELGDNDRNEYQQELKSARLKAIIERDVAGLKSLASVMFVAKSRIQGTSPKAYAKLAILYDKLTAWINQTDAKSNR